MKERLQKILARAGLGSRRKCEEFISEGRVKVEGEVISAMGSKADPSIERITVDNLPLPTIDSDEKKIYLLLNKPAGYVTTLSDPQGRPIVTDLLQDIKTRIFPVGRLDLNSEGALIFTNDGQLTNHILHPRYGIKKTYIVTVTYPPTAAQISRLEQGITIEGEKRKTLPASIRFVCKKRGDIRLQIIIHEGKKRQIRKMFSAIGHSVKKLQRTAYGGLSLGNLASGKSRFLEQKDIKKIFSGKIPFTIRNIPD
jgi:pseudouridine synthase